uniref:Uncharacterized protein n=1 Tax=Pristionchus pacificus TaxID=54126 RepID=A0A2A6CYV5_PRIPA|eukprot:PDM83290.1 hypothetical protein PRIPAC_34922 [Pristionchus pacificus]
MAPKGDPPPFCPPNCPPEGPNWPPKLPGGAPPKDCGAKRMDEPPFGKGIPPPGMGNDCNGVIIDEEKGRTMPEMREARRETKKIETLKCFIPTSTSKNLSGV